MSAFASHIMLSAVAPRAPGGVAAQVRSSPPSAPDAPPVSDALLIARVLAGDDRHAFAELTRRHQSAVRTLLRRLTRNDAGLADDLAQDTFIQVYRNLRQFRSGDDLPQDVDSILHAGPLQAMARSCRLRRWSS